MENIQNEEVEVLTDEAKQAETEALQEASQDDVRQELIDKYGLDEENQPEVIDKLVADTLDQRKKFTTAIRQKINWRNKATVQPIKKDEQKPEPKADENQISNLVSEKVRETLEARDLEDSDLPDGIKSQVKTYSKVNNVSVKQTMKSEYIKYLISQEEQKLRADNASISNKKTNSKSTRDFKDIDPKDIDVSTPEGRKKWDEYKQYLRQG